MSWMRAIPLAAGSAAAPGSRRQQARTAGLLALCLASAGPRAEDEARRSITVSGEAEQRVAPDMATLQMEVLTQGPDAAAARRQADELTAQAVAALQEAGIDDSDFDSSSLSISPQYRWLEKEGRQELIGYRVSRSIAARLFELDRLGALLIRLTDAGVNRVLPPQLGVAEDESIQQQVMAAAAANARQRAEALANALGESLAEVLDLSVNGGPQPRPLGRELMMMASDAPAAAPGESYQAGHVTFSASVTARFALR